MSSYPVTVTFSSIYDNSSSIQLTLYSKFTCIYAKYSGIGKTYLYQFLQDNLIKPGANVDADIDDTSEKSPKYINVEISEPGLVFTLGGDFLVNERTILNPDEPRRVVLVDEVSILESGLIKAIQKSKHLYICISRSMPFTSFYCMQGIYKLVTYDDNGNTYFDINPVESLPIATDFNKHYDNIIVESAPNKSEHELLSCYIDDTIICASGKGNIAKKLLKISGSALVFADLGNIGDIYGKLIDVCTVNKDIVFYDYQCFEHLLFESGLVRRYANKVRRGDIFNELTLEKFYEHSLEDVTKGTIIEYKHSKNHNPQLSSLYRNYSNFDLIFNSRVGRSLYEYLKKYGKVK